MPSAMAPGAMGRRGEQGHLGTWCGPGEQQLCQRDGTGRDLARAEIRHGQGARTGKEPAPAAQGLPDPCGREQWWHLSRVATTDHRQRQSQARGAKQRGTGSAWQQRGLGHRTLQIRLLGKHGPWGTVCCGKAASTMGRCQFLPQHCGTMSATLPAPPAPHPHHRRVCCPLSVPWGRAGCHRSPPTSPAPWGPCTCRGGCRHLPLWSRARVLGTPARPQRRSPGTHAPVTANELPVGCWRSREVPGHG